MPNLDVNLGRWERKIQNKFQKKNCCGDFIFLFVSFFVPYVNVPIEALIFFQANASFQLLKFTAMITLHFHLQPQYKYELFHITFTSFHCTGRYELNKLTSLPMCGFIAQLVEHRTGIVEVTGSNPVEALIFFKLTLLSNSLNWKIYCDDHSLLSSTTAVQIWII